MEAIDEPKKPLNCWWQKIIKRLRMRIWTAAFAFQFSHFPQSGHKKLIQPSQKTPYSNLQLWKPERLETSRKRWKIGCEICTKSSTCQRHKGLGSMQELLASVSASPVTVPFKQQTHAAPTYLVNWCKRSLLTLVACLVSHNKSATFHVNQQLGSVTAEFQMISQNSAECENQRSNSSDHSELLWEDGLVFETEQPETAKNQKKDKTKLFGLLELYKMALYLSKTCSFSLSKEWIQKGKNNLAIQVLVVTEQNRKKTAGLNLTVVKIHGPTSLGQIIGQEYQVW